MIRQSVLIGAVAVSLGACAGDVLPSTSRETAGPFPSYEIAETAYKIIVPGTTTKAKLREFGIDPATTPNLRVINYVEVMQVFMPTDTVTLADLDPAVQGCLAAKNRCVGYLLEPKAAASQRTGSVPLDMMGFDRETQETGWAASMLILLVDDLVVYKLWSGTQRIEEKARQTNPLGPAQDLSDKLKDAIPKP